MDPTLHVIFSQSNHNKFRMSNCLFQVLRGPGKTLPPAIDPGPNPHHTIHHMFRI